jgi:hypothetical protein
MGENIFKGFMQPESPRWGATSIIVGMSLSLDGRSASGKQPPSSAKEDSDLEGAVDQNERMANHSDEISGHGRTTEEDRANAGF